MKLAKTDTYNVTLTRAEMDVIRILTLPFKFMPPDIQETAKSLHAESSKFLGFETEVEQK